MTFLKWHYFSALILAFSLTQIQGAPPSPLPSPTDIKARRDLLEKTTPGNIPPDSSIAQTLESENRFRSLATSWPSPAEITKQFEFYVSQLPPGTRITLDEVKPVLEMQLLLARRENLDRVREYLKKTDLDSANHAAGNSQAARSDSFSQVASRYEDWPIRDVQIPSNPDHCLALDSTRLKCFLTVGEFNREALTFREPKSKPLLLVRSRLLDKSLNVVYYAEQARITGHADQPGVRQSVARRLKKLRRPDASTLATDTVRMKSMYLRLYDSLFSAREEVDLKLIGSTDSLYMDSLYRSISAGNSRKLSRKQKDSLPQVPWLFFRDSQLPPAMVHATDTLPLGGITPPLRLPYGSFILQVAALRNRPEKTFQEARPMLYNLLQSGRGGMDSSLREKEALALYKSHPERFLTSDTVILKWWLFPAGQPPFSVKAFHLLANRKSFSMQSTDIPPGLMQSIASKISDTVPISPDSIMGPVSTPLGTVYWSKIGLHRGGKQRSYASARPEIIAIINAMPESILNTPGDEWERANTDESLANSFWIQAIASTPKPTDREVKIAMSKGLIPREALALRIQPDDSLSGAREWLFDQRWSKPLAEWKAALWLDKARLSQ